MRMTRLWTAEGWQVPTADETFWESRGVMHGLGCFETLRVQDGVVQLWEQHRSRWQQAWQRLGFADSAWKGVFLLDDLQQFCAESGAIAGIQRLRLTALARAGALNQLSATAPPWVSATLTPITPAAPSLRLQLCPWRRNARSPLAGIKSTAYAENLLALDWARQHGVDELLWLNERDEICEASTSNVFWFREGQWFTPALATGCLPGIMRAELCQRAAAVGRHVQECAGGIEVLCKAQCVVLSSALRGVQWVKCLGLSSEQQCCWEEAALTHFLEMAQWSAEIAQQQRAAR